MRATKLIAAGAAVAVVAVGAVVMLGSDSPAFRCAPEGHMAAVTATSGSWTIPIGQPYTLTSRYGIRTDPISGTTSGHGGHDLATSGGRAPILAAASGTVVVGDKVGTATTWGRYVKIDHGGGIETLYAHMSELNVAVGDTVTTGQRIGIEGATGRVTGPHLHFEVYKAGARTDPTAVFTTKGLTFNGEPGAAVSDNTPVPITNSLSGNTVVPGQASQSVRDALPNPAGTDLSSRLTTQQWETARQLVDGGVHSGASTRALLVMLATALQESTLGANPSTKTPNRDGDVGVLQQRAKLGWYADGATVAENAAILNNHANAAAAFFQGHTVTQTAHAAATRAGSTPAGPVGYHIPGLFDIAGWESMTITGAAQAVQRSAYPNAYATHEATAAAILTTVGVNPDAAQYAASCDGLASKNPTAKLAGDTAGEKVVNAARAWLGTPYSWGGGTATGPSTGFCCSPNGNDGTKKGFDCSGLTLYAWAQVGVTLPHLDSAQREATTPVPKSQLKAGDLLFFPGHVGIYDGQGGMIHASNGVEYTPRVFSGGSYYDRTYLGAGRPAAQDQ